MFQGPRALAAADAPLAIASPSVEVLSRLALAAELAGVLEEAGGLAGLATASLEAWGRRVISDSPPWSKPFAHLIHHLDGEEVHLAAHLLPLHLEQPLDEGDLPGHGLALLLQAAPGDSRLAHRAGRAPPPPRPHPVLDALPAEAVAAGRGGGGHAELHAHGAAVERLQLVVQRRRLLQPLQAPSPRHLCKLGSLAI